jgi:hypothetical protein
MAALIAHYDTLFWNCPPAAPGPHPDAGFPQATCEAQASTGCTSDERSKLESFSSCVMGIPACATLSDGDMVAGDYNECSTISGATTVSSGCFHAAGLSN